MQHTNIEQQLYSCSASNKVRNPRTDRCVLRSGTVGSALVSGLEALRQGQVPRANTGDKLADAAVRTLQRQWAAVQRHNNADTRSVARLTASTAVAAAVARNLENKLRAKANNLDRCGAKYDQLAAAYQRSEARLRELENALLNMRFVSPPPAPAPKKKRRPVTIGELVAAGLM